MTTLLSELLAARHYNEKTRRGKGDGVLAQYRAGTLLEGVIVALLAGVGMGP